MKILAIETSCDDTGIAILGVKEGKTPEFSVLANVVASQIEMGKKYGGVFPAMAKREHQRNLLPALIKALKKSNLLKISNFQFGVPFGSFNEFSIKQISKLKEILEREPELAKKLIPFLKKYQKPNIDAIAITNGPGLEPCLWVGVNFAKVLSCFWNIPIIPVNHIEGHILVNWLPIYENSKSEIRNPKLPVVALIVSGGHTQIVLMEKVGKYQILGETRDDAAGECFDKCAKILGLSYPGGPIISELAKKSKSGIITLPRPMLNTKDYDFSFSGLKTAVLYMDRDTKLKNKKYKEAMCSEIQQAIIDVLIKKTMKAVKDFGAKTLILGGGVSANQELRRQFQAQTEKNNIAFLVPPANLSTDNGLMIAVAGYFHKNEKMYWSRPVGRGCSTKSAQTLEANANLRLK